MRRPPSIEMVPASPVTVLSVSPVQDDHISLKAIFDRSGWTLYTDSRWALQSTMDLESALVYLRENRISLVVTECDLAPGSWRDLLAETFALSDPPLLIVTSRLADECLWAEALNLGAYDVLVKPFECEEVIRVLSLAWLHRKQEHEIHSSRSRNVMLAAAG